MRISIPDDFDDIRRLPRERGPERTLEAPLPPSPLEIRMDKLRYQKEHTQQLGLRRTYAKSPSLEPPRDDPRLTRSHELPHDHPVSRRTRRNELPHSILGPTLRPEEKQALGVIGRFRVVSTRDLAVNIYGGRGDQLARDLRYMEQHGLVRVQSINARRDGRGGKIQQIEVVTLTVEGRRAAGQYAHLPRDQKLYDGLVKPREVEHDAQIYRAYIKEAQRIEARGGSNLRVRLDFELKSQAQRAIHAARKENPSRDIDEVKAQVAASLSLSVVDHQIQIPDARIEYDLDQGSRSGCSDIEVVTAAYHAGHLHAKVQAGFALYASTSDRSTLCARAEDEHHMLDSILEL